MPELSAGGQRWQVAPGTNLLDALNGQGVRVPSGCRAGHCHSCKVRCLSGQPHDLRPDALPAAERAAGWCLACQCQVVENLEVVPYNPALDGIEARVSELNWLSPQVLRLRLLPLRPLRYQPGQHLLLWNDQGVARPYSLASLPQKEPWLEFHLHCGRPGAFTDRAQGLRVGDPVRLGEVLSGPLHYDPAWDARPLWLVASNTGLAPLWAILRQALEHHHHAPIRVVHLAAPGEHYLAGELHALAAAHPGLAVDLRGPEADLADLRPPRQTIALACGSPGAVQAMTRRLFMAGLPRSQLFAEVFDTNAA
jgi:NAD(P)H-flavin reductase/ferredoxin